MEQVKEHLRIDFVEDDSYIEALISVARDYAEGLQRRSLGTQTLELTLSCFSPHIHLPRGPVQSVTSVKYTRLDGTSVTLAPSGYMLTTADDLYPLPYSNRWPVEMLIPADGVQIRYVAGYDNVPPATKQGMLLMIGHWYENREAVVVGKVPAELPLAAKSLLWMDRTW